MIRLVLYLLVPVWIGVAVWLSRSVASCIEPSMAIDPSASWIETRIACLQANELGDYLAGIFAPLAFFLLLAQFSLQFKETREAQRSALMLHNDEKFLTGLETLSDDFKSSFTCMSGRTEQGWVLKDLKETDSEVELFEALCKATKMESDTDDFARVLANNRDGAINVCKHLKRLAKFEARVSERYRSLIDRNDPKKCAELIEAKIRS